MKPKLTKKELGALRAVRDMLDTGLIERNRPTTGIWIRDHIALAMKRIFDMSIPLKTTNCGTVACIGGWTGAMMGMSPANAENFVTNYNEGGKFHELFYPVYNSKLTAHYGKIKPEHAVKAIDNFLATGNPNWMKVLPVELRKYARQKDTD